MDRSVKREL
uniref:Uncharacterized protein n=1 Tax=Arundo donax TaxID=35708 RepID=A0A0A8ZQZ8_ARUDO